MLIQHFEFRTEYWERYRAVNLRFAHAVADEAERCDGPHRWRGSRTITSRSSPEFLRAMRPSLFIHQFWHIPFPPPDILRLLPSGITRGVLRGLLGNDLVEFQIDRYALNFLDCVAEFIPEARVDRANQTIRFRDRVVQVGAFPISIDVETFQQMARIARERDARARRCASATRKASRQLGVCVDRVDYTKGIPERIRALETALDRAPGAARAVHVHLRLHAVAHRSPAYTQLEQDVDRPVIAINERFGTADWTPIVLINENVDADLLAAVYRAARPVHRVVAAGRDESRREGIRRRASSTSAACCSSAGSPAPPRRSTARC